MIIFKRNLLLIAFYFICVVSFILALGSIQDSDLKFSLWFIIIITFYQLWLLSKKKVVQIEINSLTGVVTFYYVNRFYVKSSVCMDIADMNFKYEKTFGAGGVSFFVFRIYQDDKAQVELQQFSDGWSKKALLNLQAELTKLKESKLQKIT